MPVADLARALEPELFHVIVFGPGFGESIAIGAPDDAWLIVDSLGVPKGDPTFVPAIELLRTRGVAASALVVTHPHDDHVIGIDRLLASYVDGPVGVVELSQRAVFERRGANAGRALRVSNRMKAMSAVLGYWLRNDGSRWDLRATGEQLRLGSATVEVLHPDELMIQGAIPEPATSPNPWSAALLVEWEGVRVVLGADLPSQQWSAVLGRPRTVELSHHSALKISHHGSLGAQHDALLKNQDSPRFRIATPWHLSGGILPRLADGEGLDVLLTTEAKVELTATGRALTRRVTTPLTRSELRAIIDIRDLPAGVQMEVERDADPDESWIAISYDQNGSLVQERRGAAAVVITP